MVFAYPVASDAEAALAIVWQKVSGGTVSVADLANASWTLEGYALFLGIPKVAPAYVADPAADLAALIKPHATAHKLGDGSILKTLSGLPWAQIIGLLGQLLGGLGGGGAPVSGS